VKADSGGDPLRAMYLLASLLMAAACVLIVLLMFLPSDAFTRQQGEDTWTPGSIPGYVPPIEVPADAMPEHVREELHLH